MSRLGVRNGETKDLSMQFEHVRFRYLKLSLHVPGMFGSFRPKMQIRNIATLHIAAGANCSIVSAID